MDGEDDQIVPVKDSAGKPAKLIKGAKNSTIPGRLTALPLHFKINADLVGFVAENGEK